jgi:hypothetical protein
MNELTFEMKNPSNVAHQLETFSPLLHSLMKSYWSKCGLKRVCRSVVSHLSYQRVTEKLSYKESRSYNVHTLKIEH